MAKSPPHRRYPHLLTLPLRFQAFIMGALLLAFASGGFTAHNRLTATVEFCIGFVLIVVSYVSTTRYARRQRAEMARVAAATLAEHQRHQSLAESMAAHAAGQDAARSVFVLTVHVPVTTKVGDVDIPYDTRCSCDTRLMSPGQVLAVLDGISQEFLTLHRQESSKLN